MSEKRILGILVSKRLKIIGAVQTILTRYGCIIKTRLGLHQITDKTCTNRGMIILELTGSIEKKDALEKELKALHGIEVQKMTFKK